MKRLAIWASQHIWLSRILITFSYLNIIFLALVTGFFFFSEGINFGDWVYYLLLILYIVLRSLYPSKKAYRSTSFYKRKVFDFTVVITTFLIFVFIGNRSDKNIVSKFTVAAATTPAGNNFSNPATTATISIEDPNAVKKPKLSKSKQKKQFRAFLHKLKKKFNDQSTGVKILLILLLILLAAVLFYLVAALSCSIACSSGADAAAGSAIVFYGGTAAILVGLFFGIRRVIRGPKVKKAEPEK